MVLLYLTSIKENMLRLWDLRLCALILCSGLLCVSAKIVEDSNKKTKYN